MTVVAQNPWLDVRTDKNRYCVRTSERFVRHRRRSFRLLCGIAAVAGVVLVGYTPWGAALATAGMLGLAAAPALFGPADLLEVDLDAKRLIALQPTVGRGTSISLARMERVTGAYEVYGWDPRSTIYAELGDGQRVPILVFTGTNDSLAEEACGIVGRLSGRTAVYTGPFGDPKTCFDGATARASVDVAHAQDDDDHDCEERDHSAERQDARANA